MPTCHLCKMNHQLKYCKYFLALSPALRRKSVEKQNMCINCLAHTHTVDQCYSFERCRYCASVHHALLHVDPNGEQVPRTIPNNEENSRRPAAKNEYCLVTPQTPVVVPALFQANVHYQDYSEVLTFLVLSNFEHSAMLWNVANKFPGFKATYNEDGEPFGRFMIHSMGPKFDFILPLKQSFDIPPIEPINDTRLRAHFSKFLPLAHENFHAESKVDVIIGKKSWQRIKTRGFIKENCSLPIAQATHFGWVIHGVWMGCACLSHEAKYPIMLPRRGRNMLNRVQQ
ncbi:uncharacterized protein LOC142226265 [Haematobia irritans]|uniref:uncharacterized protein LOC142226265 n=1 Tax=Haematobia irritans TaxID=7368 RepID=UPI003F508F94